MENMRDLNELVEAMDQAHFRLATGAPYTQLQTNIDGMTAALRVAEPVIEQRRDGQWEKASCEELRFGNRWADWPITNFIERVRARIAAPKKAKSAEELLAERIVAALFVSGLGEQADRLVLTSGNGKDLGGWCRQAVVGKLQPSCGKARARSERANVRSRQ